MNQRLSFLLFAALVIFPQSEQTKITFVLVGINSPKGKAMAATNIPIGNPVNKNKMIVAGLRII